MPIFPQIQRPCPYKDRLASVMEGDFCRMCHRRVIDVTSMSDDERVVFMNGCEQEVCVSYRLPTAVAAAALAVAAAAVPTVAAAAVPTEATPQSDEQTIVVGGAIRRAPMLVVPHLDAHALDARSVHRRAKAPPAATPAEDAAPQAPVVRRSGS
jgi:predicted Fe-S protein YdhL (DUF1289 family)